MVKFGVKWSYKFTLVNIPVKKRKGVSLVESYSFKIPCLLSFSFLSLTLLSYRCFFVFR